jgi:hypothetical protein
VDDVEAKKEVVSNNYCKYNDGKFILHIYKPDYYKK